MHKNCKLCCKRQRYVIPLSASPLVRVGGCGSSSGSCLSGPAGAARCERPSALSDTTPSWHRPDDLSPRGCLPPAPLWSPNLAYPSAAVVVPFLWRALIHLQAKNYTTLLWTPVPILIQFFIYHKKPKQTLADFLSFQVKTWTVNRRYSWLLTYRKRLSLDNYRD